MGKITLASMPTRPDFIDLTGQRFGMWTVIEYTGFTRHTSKTGGKIKRQMWLCSCKCGEVSNVHGTNLKSGGSLKCGGCVNGVPVNSHLSCYSKSVSANYAASRHGAIGKLSSRQVDQLFSSHGWCCYYCGVQSVDTAVMTLDHVIPFARGGQNTIQNCVPACKKCNSTKGDMTAKEFEVL